MQNPLAERPTSPPSAASPVHAAATPARSLGSDRRMAQRKRRDRRARWIVTGGGVAIIASVLGILLFLVWQVVPLLRSASVEPRAAIAAPACEPLAVVGDEARAHAALLGRDGVVRVVRTSDGAVVVEQPLFASPDGAAPRATCGAPLQGEPGFVCGSSDGRVAVARLRFSGETPAIDLPFSRLLDVGGRAIVACAASGRGASSGIAVALADGSVRLIEQSIEENLFTGEQTATDHERVLTSAAPVVALALDTRRENLYAATPDGRLLWWELEDAAVSEPLAIAVGAPVTALQLLIGDQSLVVGQSDGALSIWNRMRGAGSRHHLGRTHDFPPLAAPVRRLAPSWRDRTFAALADDGELRLCYSTTTRVLWSGRSPLPAPTAVALSPKNDGVLLAAAGSAQLLDVESRHPEAGLGAFFGEIWYEGYPAPAHIWQSSSGSNEAEAKFGLAPLLFGTLKATLFSLLFAVPLGLAAAMYTSQFMHWSLRRAVKPAVEIMASLPSVVLGFLAGLWLAPRIAEFFLGVPLFLVLAPLTVIAAGRLGERLPARWRHRFPEGSESLASIGVLAVTLAVAIGLSRPVESACFGGDFVRWMREALGIAYDQKNCIVLGLAMGIAVIPIIFSIAEDAFSNVPNSLVSGSLALGADRWYTVTRVVLPTASPGLFSAVMIGFGRAVGETMIVVMASGNTPIMDWSPFNGLRSLSANIATEIPEAPEGSTFFRTLFLAALLLFAVTFAANTAAELVRMHLRQKYARL